MFCMNCGKQLPDGAKFCSECGTKLSSYNSSKKTEKNIETIEAPLEPVFPIDEPIEFAFKGNILRFDSSYREYTKKRKVFFSNFFSYLSMQQKELKEELKQSTDYDNQVDCICEFGNCAIDECIHQGHQFLLTQGVYSISEQMLKHRCSSLIENGAFAKTYNQFEEGYLEIVATDEQMKEYRQMVKASRGHWEGGGFGISGAIKGAVTAGAMNAVGSAIYGIGDFISSEVDSHRIATLKRDYLNSKNWVSICIAGVIADIGVIFDQAYQVYSAEKNIPSPRIDFKKKEMYLSNALALKNNLPEFFKVYAMALQEYPFARRDYWNLLEETSVADHEVLQLMEFFLPAPFLNNSAAINAILNRQLKKMPEDTYDELDIKIAYLDQVLADIKKESTTSTVCKKFLNDFLPATTGLQEQIVKKRLTAEDGEEFSSKDEVDRYQKELIVFGSHLQDFQNARTLNEKLAVFDEIENETFSFPQHAARRENIKEYLTELTNCNENYQFSFPYYFKAAFGAVSLKWDIEALWPMVAQMPYSPIQTILYTAQFEYGTRMLFSDKETGWIIVSDYSLAIFLKKFKSEEWQKGKNWFVFDTDEISRFYVSSTEVSISDTIVHIYPEVNSLKSGPLKPIEEAQMIIHDAFQKAQKNMNQRACPMCGKKLFDTSAPYCGECGFKL